MDDKTLGELKKRAEWHLANFPPKFVPPMKVYAAELLKLIAENERLSRLAERQERAVKAARTYRDNYLLDEIDEPELCISTEQHSMLVELNNAINDCNGEPGKEAS